LRALQDRLLDGQPVVAAPIAGVGLVSSA
jgi:hypothetical protein